jgi:hypothetical protein
MAVTESFHYKGQLWQRVTYLPERKFCVGLDLGQASDPSAIAVVEHHRTPLAEYAPNYETRVTTQLTKEFFDVRHLERLPLGISYLDICAYVAKVMARRPLREFDARLVVDQTGCGRPASDILRRAGLRFAAVTITAGDSEIYVGRDEYRVPKHLLVTSLDARLSTKELRFSEKLKEAAAMKAELQDFRHSISVSGHMSYNARSGAHDDLVLACGLAVWWLGHRKSRGEFSWGTVRGLC